MAQTVQTSEGGTGAEWSFNQGLSKVQRSDYKGAIEHFTQAIKLNSRHGEAYYQRALVLSKVRWLEIDRPSSPVEDLEQAIKLNPGLIEAYLQLAILKEDTSYIKRALAINPAIAEGYYHRGQIRSRKAVEYLADEKREPLDSGKTIAEVLTTPSRTGRSPKKALASAYSIVWLSIRDYTHAISLKPDYVESYLARGLAKMALKEYEPAIGDFTSAIRLNPKQSEAYTNRGLAQQALTNHKAAIEDFTEAIAIKPMNVESYKRRGLSRLEAGDKSGAIEDYVRIIGLGRADENRDRPYLQRLGDDALMAGVYYEFGMKYRSDQWEGANDRAISNFSRAVELNPNLASAWYQRGLALAEGNHPATALKDFNRAIHLMPGEADFYFSRALALFETKDYAAAVADYTKALDLSSGFPNTYYQRGVAHLASGDWQRAIADFTETIKLNPESPEAYYRRAIAFDRSGDKAKAIADYLTTIEKSISQQDVERVFISEESDSVASVYYRGLATLTFVLREHREKDYSTLPNAIDAYQVAMNAFTEVIRLSPNRAEAYYQRTRLGWQYYPGGPSVRSESLRIPAESDLNRAIELRPSFAEAYLERGLVYCASARIEECFVDLNKAIELEHRWARAYYERARVTEEHHREVKAERVLQDYDQAIKLNPDYIDAYSARRRVRQKQGDVQGALADLTELARLSPYNVSLHRENGRLRVHFKDYSGAILDFTRAIELDPGVPGGVDHDAGASYYDRGLVRYELGDGLGALEDYEYFRLVDICPKCKSGSVSVANVNNADLFYLKGMSLSLRGDKAGAKKSFQEASKLYHTAGNMKKYQDAKYQVSKL